MEDNRIPLVTDRSLPDGVAFVGGLIIGLIVAGFVFRAVMKKLSRRSD